MSQSFDALGVSAAVVRGLERSWHHVAVRRPESRPPRRPRRRRRPGRVAHGSGKTLAFGIPMIERTAGGGGHPSALVLVPTRELASQVVADLRPLAAARGLRIEAVYGGTSVGGSGQEGPRRRDPRRHAGTARRPDRPAAHLAPLGPGARARRGRPHARHGLPAAGRPLLVRGSAEPADHALLGDARRAGHGARAPLHRQRRPGSRQAPKDAEAPARSSTSSTPSRPTTSSRASPSSSDGSAASRSSSSAPSTAPTSSPGSSIATTTYRRWSCTGTCPRTPASGRCVRFESGQVTTLIATDVAARGLDIDEHHPRDQLRSAPHR